MEETGTLVLWPSKLKIGAKSKKGKITNQFPSKSLKLRNILLYISVRSKEEHIF
jgi:hypothetical protein